MSMYVRRNGALPMTRKRKMVGGGLQTGSIAGVVLFVMQIVQSRWPVLTLGAEGDAAFAAAAVAMVTAIVEGLKHKGV